MCNSISFESWDQSLVTHCYHFRIVLGDNTILSYIAIFTYDVVFKLQYRHIVFQDFCVFGVIYPYLCNSLMEAVVKLSASYAFPNALYLLDHSGMDIVIFSNIVTFQVVIYHW